MPDEITPKSLVTKLAEVMAEIDHVEKRGLNQFQNYKYVRAADVARAVRDGLAKRGIVMLSQIINVRSYEIPAREGTMQAIDLHIRYTFNDGTDTLSTDGYGTGTDKGDKASYKAQTGALKYALRNAFLIPDESDPEADAAVDVATSESATSAPLPPNQPPKLAVPPSSLKEQFKKAGVQVPVGAFLPSPLPIGEGVITFTEVKSTKPKDGKSGGKPYFAVTQNGNKLACWESKQPHLLRAELWTALSDANGKYAKLIVTSEPDKIKPNVVWHNIVGILKAGDKEWLEDGTPVIQREPPTEEVNAEFAGATDEETGLPF